MDDRTFTWANSAGANTEATVDIPKPVVNYRMYQVTVYNPSTVTALTVKLEPVKQQLASATRYPVLRTFSVAANSVYCENFYGIFTGDLRIAASNDTILGGSDGFTATIRIEEIE
jgi:hypothetical protein